MQVNNSLKSFQKKMESLISLTKDLSTIRTGRAHTSMLDLIKVEVYGQLTPINQVGTISISVLKHFQYKYGIITTLNFVKKH